MTPEELQRSMDFIIRQQAQFHADVQREQERRVQVESLFKSTILKLTDLAQIESQRLEGHDQRLERHDRELRRSEQWHKEFMTNAQKNHEEAMARLDRILERLSRPES